MAVMCPDNGLGALTAMLEDSLESVKHVRISEIPRFVSSAVHGLVILLGIWRQISF
jgi:hypothetical protein